MANFTLKNQIKFPVGLGVGAYPISGWPGGIVNTKAAPPGPATDTQLMTANGVTFTGLDSEERYVAYIPVSGGHNYVAFTVSGDDSLEAALRPFDRDDGHAGLYVPRIIPFGLPGSNALTANRTQIVRFVPSRNMTIISIAFNVTVVAGTGDSNVDLGIYSGDGQTKMGSTGPVAAPLTSTGVKNKTLLAPVELEAGVTYYAALATAATFPGTAPQITSQVIAGNAATLFGATLGLIDAAHHTAGGTLPATLTPVVTGFVPVLALREA